MIRDTQDTVIRLCKKELEILNEFYRVLKDERDFIISFSVEGIIECNNRKESLLKEIEFIESERERIIESLREPERERVKGRIKEMRDSYFSLLGDISAQMERNMRLLTFSMDNMKGIIERIIEGLTKNMEYTRGKLKGESLSLILSKEV